MKLLQACHTAAVGAPAATPAPLRNSAALTAGSRWKGSSGGGSHRRLRSKGAMVCHAEGPPRAGRPVVVGENGSVIVGEYGERVVLEGMTEDEDVRLECDESGCVLVLGKNVRDLEEVKSEGYLHCNLSGCFYSPDTPSGEFQVLEGAGWRLGYETAPASEDSFSAMVGAGGWSIALTASEFHDFCKLVQMLRKGIITMDQDGILGRDDIVMQVEKGSLWMECVVAKKVLPTLQKFLKFGGRAEKNSAFEIRFILTGKADKRQAEGYWPADAVLDMLKKIDDLTKLQPLGDSQGALPSEGVPVSA